MSPPQTRRRRPHCHTCGSPMAGHKRIQGRLVCPEWSPATTTLKTITPSILASPPLTPPRELPLPHTPTSPAPAPAPAPAPSPTRARRTSPRRPVMLVFPETGPWHRRNPNWRTPTPPPPVPPPRAPSPVGSLVPTVLVDDDGNTIQGSVYPSDVEWDDDQDDNQVKDEDEDGYDTCGEHDDPFGASSYASLGAMDQITGRPLVSIYGTSRRNIPQLRSVAAKLGAHAGFLPTPPRSQRKPQSPKKGRKGSLPVARQGSWWCVVSKSPELVRRVVDSQHRGLPGLMGEDLQPEGPRMTTFLHLTLAGFVGGCVAVYGLSFL